jgi:hypothetical protein
MRKRNRRKLLPKPDPIGKWIIAHCSGKLYIFDCEESMVFYGKIRGMDYKVLRPATLEEIDSVNAYGLQQIKQDMDRYDSLPRRLRDMQK